MDIIYLLLILLALVVLHEAAHAVTMRQQGIAISEAGLGLPFPPVLHVKPRRLPFQLTFSPWLLGAYVEMSPEHLPVFRGLPYRQRSWILNSGVVVNLLAGLACWAVVAAVNGHPITAAVMAAAAAAMWLWRTQVAAYLLPALAVPALAATVYALTKAWSMGETGLGFAGIGDLIPAGGGIGWLYLAGQLSLALAVLNCLPFYGLDNGKVFGEALQRLTRNTVTIRIYRTVGLVVLAAILVGSIVSDLWAAITNLI